MFYTIFYQPIFNLLVWLYDVLAWQDLGIAIILITLIIRIVLWPLNKRAIKSQKALQTLQPEIEALKEKHKDEKEKLAAATMALYKEKKINPFGSCLPILVQLPILFAIYRVFFDELRNGPEFDGNILYSFVANPGTLNPIAFGFFDLSERSILLAILAGLGQFWQSKMMMAKAHNSNSAANALSQQMVYFMPVITIIIGASLPAGLTLYWLLTTVFTILQQYLTFGFKKSTIEVVDKK